MKNSKIMLVVVLGVLAAMSSAFADSVKEAAIAKAELAMIEKYENESKEVYAKLFEMDAVAQGKESASGKGQAIIGKLNKLESKMDKEFAQETSTAALAAKKYYKSEIRALKAAAAKPATLALAVEKIRAKKAMIEAAYPELRNSR